MKKINDIHLTVKELEVLQLLALGHSNKEIAHKMNYSVHSVKTYLESVYRKFDVHNKIQALVKAVQLGFIEI